MHAIFLSFQAKIEVYLRVLPSNSAPSPPSSFDVPFSTSHPSFHRPFPPFAFPPRPPDPSPATSNTSSIAPAPTPASTTQPPIRAIHPPEGAQTTTSAVTSTLLPILAVTGLAPVLMLVLWLVHRKCKHNEKLVAVNIFSFFCDIRA